MNVTLLYVKCIYSYMPMFHAFSICMFFFFIQSHIKDQTINKITDFLSLLCLLVSLLPFCIILLKQNPMSLSYSVVEMEIQLFLFPGNLPLRIFFGFTYGTFFLFALSSFVWLFAHRFLQQLAHLETVLKLKHLASVIVSVKI